MLIELGISEDIFSSQWRRLGGRYECSVPVDGDLVLNCDNAKSGKGMSVLCLFFSLFDYINASGLLRFKSLSLS